MKPTGTIRQKQGFTTGKFAEGYIIAPVCGDTTAVVLNETAGFVWSKLEVPHTFNELIDIITAEYGAARSEVEVDLCDLLDILAPYIDEAD